MTVTQLLAPYTPFVADEIYDNLDGSEPSVHLTDWPEPGPAHPRDEALESAMAIARETVRLGLAARGAAKIKVRQPLHEVVVVAAGREREAIERLGEIVREELNVKVLRFVDEADELGSYTLKPNYRTLGPRFGKAMPQVAEAIAALDPDHVAVSLREGREIGVFIDGHDHTLGPDDLLVALAPLQDYQLEREGSHAVALELSIDDDLRREGLAREIVHAVQLARRDAGLDISDRIDLGARRRRDAARGGARARGVPRRRGARRQRGVRRQRQRRDRQHRGPRAAHLGRARRLTHAARRRPAAQCATGPRYVGRRAMR